jgi:hypothetical protein
MRSAGQHTERAPPPPPPGLRGAYWPLEGAAQLGIGEAGPTPRLCDQTQVLFDHLVSPRSDMPAELALAPNATSQMQEKVRRSRDRQRCTDEVAKH